MATATFAPQDLGRLAVVGREDVEAGVILWDRFCVVGRRHEGDHIVSVAVTDLHRVLGDSESHHRLELHLLEVANDPDERTRLRRAIAADTRIQPRVLATIETGQRLALISEAPQGNSLDTVQVAIAAEGVIRRAAPLDRRSLLVLAGELAQLLSKLHEADVFGVEFDRHQLRVQRGRFTLDGFDHLMVGVDERSPARDLERLSVLLGELGGEAASAIRHPLPESAVELWQRVRSLAGNNALTEEVDLPAEPPFVGRERPLQVLGEGLDQARIAQPALIVVRGNRGVGKSRLLREFVAARLAANDAFVLTGTWQPRSAETRGGLLGALDQLARALRGLDIGEREAIRQRINKSIRNLGAVLTKSAPSLGNVLRSIEELPRLELGEDFSRHTATIGDLLRSLGTQKRPLVLVLDNLEVADSSSLAVLRVLAQQRPAHHTLVIAGLRDERRTFHTDFEAEFLELEPLSAPDVGRLLARTLPGSIADLDALAEALWAVSDGFPLAVWANLRAWLDRGLLVHGESTWRARRNLRDDVHREPDVRDLFGFRLAGAEDEVRVLALRLAVLGFELSLADARILGQTDSTKSAPAAASDVDAAIDDLVERGILTRTEHGVRFPHDSIRELVLESAEPEQRRNAHGRVADLLGTRDAPAAQIAYHRDLAFDEEQAKPADFDLLSRLHVDAGRERLGVYDLERARWHLERALEYSRDSDQRAVAAEALADTYLLSDDLEGATVLYTALIATAEPERAIVVANKAVHYLFNKSMMNEARQLGELALDRADEPRPETPLGRVYHTARALIGALFGEPNMPIGLREALVRLYPQLFVTVLISDLSLVVFSAARVLWLYRGLRSGATASARSFVASIRAILGHYHSADRGFSEALEIAIAAKDAWGRGVVLHNWAHMSLLPSGRYEQGQRMLDDAVVAFRETGDVSISIMSVLMKSLYGRDREPIDTVITWVDEGIAMARRHGTEVGLLALEAVKLAMLARQGRNDVVPRLLSLSVAIETPDIGPTVRLIARTQLAYAALDAGDEVAAFYQVSTGQDEMASLHAVPEFCQELHAATVFVVLSHKYPNREELRLLTRALRKLKRAASRSPRLAVLAQLFQLKRAVVERNNERAHALASLLIGSLDRHGNLHAAREAHRALAQSLKAENVLAAAEHERIARNIGRRLGLGASVLNTEFDDPMEYGSLPLALSSSADAALLDSQSGPIPIDRGKGPAPLGSFERDVLQAWALDVDKPRTRLGDVLEPVRQAVQPSMPDVQLEIRCAEPGLELAASAVDLQLLLINLLMTARDSVAGRCTIELLATQERIRESDGEDVAPGRYLALRVLARGSSNEVPTLGGYGISEGLAVQLGGFLRGSTDRGAVTLIAHLPLDNPRDRASGKVLIIHSDEAMRSTVGAALRQLGVEPIEYDPGSFETGHLDGATLVFADAIALRSLRVLEPLLDARLIEVGRRGAVATTDERESLRVPFAMSELEALIGVSVRK
ncbi:ATP-binding protein [Nannocystaceae bacterium ST9]